MKKTKQRRISRSLSEFVHLLAGTNNKPKDERRFNFNGQAFPRFPTIESTPRGGVSSRFIRFAFFYPDSAVYLSLPSQPSTIISIMFFIRTCVAFREYGSP